MGVHLCQRRVKGEIWINVKEYWHVDLLVRVKALFLEAKTLDLVEVRPRLERHNCMEYL